MRYMNEINIGKSVLHTVDTASDEVIYAKELIELNESKIDYLTKHIEKSLSSFELSKYRVVNYERETIKAIKRILSDRDLLVNESTGVTRNFYEVMMKYTIETKFDVVIGMFFSKGREMFYILQLDYSDAVGHDTAYLEDGVKHDIDILKKILPSAGTQLKKCAFFSLLEDETLQVYAINKRGKGVPLDFQYYFTFDFLGIDRVEDSTSMTLKSIGTNERFIKRTLKDDVSRAKQMQDRFDDMMVCDSNFKIAAYVEDVDLDKKEKEVFFSHFEKANLPIHEPFIIDKKVVEKKIETKKLVTDTGIVISCNYEKLHDPSVIEAKENGDGTIDYLIKNVRHVS